MDYVAIIPLIGVIALGILGIKLAMSSNDSFKELKK